MVACVKPHQKSKEEREILRREGGQIKIIDFRIER